MLAVAGTNSSKKVKSKEILNALNEAFSETEKPEETTLREKSKTCYLKKILKEEPAAFDRHNRK
jgi:hypothetical protein